MLSDVLFPPNLPHKYFDVEKSIVNAIFYQYTERLGSGHCGV